MEANIRLVVDHCVELNDRYKQQERGDGKYFGSKSIVGDMYMVI